MKKRGWLGPKIARMPEGKDKPEPWNASTDEMMIDMDSDKMMESKEMMMKMQLELREH